VISRRTIAKQALVAITASAALSTGLAYADDDHHDRDRHEHDKHISTRTPIKHLIVLIGENRTFDHIYGTYVPKHGQSISNLLSSNWPTNTP
jgi:phospholipase C